MTVAADIDIRLLSPALGAEVIGLDLARPLDAPESEAIQEAFLEHHLLCFRSQPLSPQNFAALARHFGEPQLQLLRHQRHAEVPEVSVLESTYRTAEDKPDDLRLVRLSGWHTDDSYFAVPAKATMLQALEIPPSAGQTRFCNTRGAYEELPEALRQRIEGRQAIHSYDTVRAPGRAPKRTPEEEAETPDVVHPLVRTHDDTGRRAIYFNPNRTDQVIGMERGASDELLDALYAHMTLDKYRYDHDWRVGDILLWDNRALIHSVNTDFPVGHVRRHQRILLRGTPPV